MEGLARRRQEERMRIRERERPGRVGVRRDKALAQLRQNHFERSTEAVQYTDALLQWHDAFDALGVGLGGAGHALGEGEVGLRIVRMDEEGGASGDVGLEQLHAGIGCVPRLYDDVVELISEELIDYALVLAADLEEVGECAYRGHAIGVLLVGLRLEDVADGVGGVAVLFDERFERAAAAVEAGNLSAELVATALGLRFFGATGFDLKAKVGDLGLQALQPLGDRLERERNLTALQPQRLQLLACDIGLGEQALGLAVESGERGFSLCLFVARLRGALDELHGGAAVLLGLLLGGGYGADGLLCLCLLALHRFAGAGGLGSGVLEEAAVLFQFACERGKLFASLREVVGAGGQAVGQFRGAGGVGRRSSGDAPDLNGGPVGRRSSLADLLSGRSAAAAAFA